MGKVVYVPRKRVSENVITVAKSGPGRSSKIKKNINHVNLELRRVRSPIYSLNRKIKSAPTKYRKGKLRKELSAYKESSSDKINSLIQQRSQLRSVIDSTRKVEAERTSIKRELASLKKRTTAAYKRNDQEAVAELSMITLNRMSRLKNLNDALGLVAPSQQDLPKERIGDLFEWDPANEYPFWVGVEKFEDDVDGGEWKFGIVGGQRLSFKYRSLAKASAMAYWISVDADSDTKINRYMNHKTKTTKYVVIKHKK